MQTTQYYGYWKGLSSLVCIFFNGKSSGGSAAMLDDTAHTATIKPDQQLADELPKYIIGKFQKYIHILLIILGAKTLLIYI